MESVSQLGFITGGTPASDNAIVTFPRARRRERDCKRSLILALTGIAISLIAEISTHAQELHLWLVIWVFDKHLKVTLPRPD